jgi:hypothetical protein
MKSYIIRDPIHLEVLYERYVMGKLSQKRLLSYYEYKVPRYGNLGYVMIFAEEDWFYFHPHSDLSDLAYYTITANVMQAKGFDSLLKTNLKHPNSKYHYVCRFLNYDDKPDGLVVGVGYGPTAKIATQMAMLGTIGIDVRWVK